MNRRTLNGVAVAAVAIIGSVLAADLFAKNVDLSTVPSRDTVQLTIYNSEDLTLVRETRKVSFKKGMNPLQFGWQNTLIDPTSVELRFLSHPDRLDLLDTTFPHDKPHMLYWNVQSELDGEAVVEISYFTSGIRWTADYLCVATPTEDETSFKGFVRVFNNSGEEYEDARLRLVVGTINLVEQIAKLAQVPAGEVKYMDESRLDNLRLQVVRSSLALAVPADKSAPNQSAAKPKEIVKEGLSEYFIYSIEGTETIPNGWSKRMRSFQGKTVPLKIAYRYRLPEYGDQLVRMYLLKNDTESGLGTTPLPDGIVRVFRENGRGGLSYLTAQSVKYVPIGDKIELNLGVDPEVVFELVPLRSWRDNIWMLMRGANVLRRVDDGQVKIEVNSTVAGWDDHQVFAQRVRNYSKKPIQLEVRRAFPGHVDFRSSLDPRKHDYQNVEYQSSVGPGERTDLLYEIVRHQGNNKKQDNVTTQDARIEP